jgi:adenylyltransferase/sulfurtransferase
LKSTCDDHLLPANAIGSPAGGKVMRISGTEQQQERDDRFHRFGLIQWWDQKKLTGARVVVVGAGALGNEIIKNLALLGIGNLLVVDLDRIENSNLSRSILYRAADNGRPKAQVAAETAREIYPAMNVGYLDANIVHDVGLGVFRWADVVIGGLDNREARLAINRACLRVNRPWIDGAIEQVDGVARVFTPDSPCYECTMSDTDWRLLQSRRSCNLLTRHEMERGGRTPTTPTISSIIAGVQCQEAIKLLHGLPTIAGGGWVFQGLSTDAYRTEFQRKASCDSHDPLERIISLDGTAGSTTAADVLAQARRHLGPTAQLELSRDVLARVVCPQCGRKEALFTSLGKVSAEKAVCPHCPGVHRVLETFYKIRGDETFANRPLASIGIPDFDILIARADGHSIGFELGGDAASVMGGLVAGEDDLDLEGA